MKTSRKCRGAGLLAALALVAALVPASAQAASPCKEWAFTAPAKSIFHKVKIPVLGSATGAVRYDADVLRPKKVGRSTRLPGIVMLHGKGGQKCALWWAARLLAGKNYETVVLTFPSGGSVTDAEVSAATATRSAIAWLRSHQNPYRSNLNANDIALVGHSLGAIAAQDVQQATSLTYIKTIVALDNLRKYLDGDPGGAVTCDPALLGRPITPRVPALGLGSETGCPDFPALTDKTTGYKNWRAANVYVEEAVLANTNHPSYAGGTPFNQAHLTQLRHAAYYMVPWLTRWLRNKPALEAALVSQTPFGIPVTQMLTDDTNRPIFTSSAFLPSKECPELRACP
jgi:pimeloyl-ACP methyl ester carboxylesterase